MFSRRSVCAASVLALLLAPLNPAVAAVAADAQAKLERFEIDIVRAEDVRAIKKLQRAYGYYADRGLWNDLADLFAEDAVANYPSGGFDGNASIRAMFVQNLGQGREGLAEGRLSDKVMNDPRAAVNLVVTEIFKQFPGNAGGAAPATGTSS